MGGREMQRTIFDRLKQLVVDDTYLDLSTASTVVYLGPFIIYEAVGGWYMVQQGWIGERIRVGNLTSPAEEIARRALWEMQKC
jgi:hypothetical protein